MYNKIKLLCPIILLICTLAAFYFGFNNKLSSHNFAPIDALYHGSVNKDIRILEPRSYHVRDKEEGEVVFATPSLKLASCYVFSWDDSWANQSISWQDGDKTDYQIIMVISDQGRFKKEDSGGSIYILPVAKFKFDKNKGLGIFEWTSKEKVVPFAQINFASALEAMKKSGVKVYFVNKEEFNHYLALPGEEQEKFLLDLR